MNIFKTIKNELFSDIIGNILHGCKNDATEPHKKLINITGKGPGEDIHRTINVLTSNLIYSKKMLEYNKFILIK